MTPGPALKLFPIETDVLIGCAVVYLAVAVYLASYLRRHHAAAWTSLGEPGLLNNSIRNSWRLLRFVWGGSYRQTNDAKVLIQVYFLRYALVAVAAQAMVLSLRIHHSS